MRHRYRLLVAAAVLAGGCSSAAGPGSAPVASLCGLHALHPGHHPDQGGRGGGPGGTPARGADQVCAVHARSRRQHAGPDAAGCPQPGDSTWYREQLRPVLTAVPGRRCGLPSLPSRWHPRQRDRTVRRRVLPGSLAAAAVAGAVAAVAIRGGQAAPAAPAPPQLATAAVVRTNLATTALTGGTLGYAATRPVVNMATGIYTWLPRPGVTIRAGGVLYRVDNTPVMLMAGGTPAWRPFALGMTDGPDVRQLQANLMAGHFADGLVTAPTGHYDLLTADAVQRRRRV